MRLSSGFVPAMLFISVALIALPSYILSQESVSSHAVIATAEIPYAPQPQFVAAADASSGLQEQSTKQPSQSAIDQSSSSSQASPQQPDAKKSQYDKAEEQIKEEEKQRIAGVVPAFNVTYHSDAVSMTAGQKMRLAFRSSIDPVTIVGGLFAAGYREGLDEDTGFGWGPEGFGKRAGAAYLDAFDGTMIGNGILPSILHQDPRFFRLGHGTIRHRLLYAISNLYYPSSGSGIGQTISNGMIVTNVGTVAAIFDEFWPDLSRKFLHRDPSHGLDAQLRAQDAAEKAARQNQK
jgi:hypothetical protein